MLFDDKYINNVDKRLLKSAVNQHCLEILERMYFFHLSADSQISSRRIN